ncbi:MFS transporter [Tunturibacter empetritectus]|uniref:Fucose permease n=1 Tax=Tunturiibacter empetritectus TaxID=3069691 RepID=A0A7W8IF24_9BACT|nr:MFS transporter [Edaphobacter lichenicola]MBB5316014.1 fucose permease [Edaphobacter lichenicola]
MERSKKEAPSPGLMHFGLMLAGLGTALLGPILPLLAKQWEMVDSQSGLMMMAKFCGAFLGGVTVSQRLRWSLLAGLVAGTVGFGGFAMSPSMGLGCIGLFVGGFGLGQIITSINILAGRRFTAHRGSALSLLNFSFSLGAMLSALLAAWLLPHFALRGVLEGFAGLFAIGLLALWIQTRGEVSGAESFDAAPLQTGPQTGLSGRVYLYFAGLLVLYGGLETCLSGWLTTFALRYGDKTLAVSEYTTLLLWMALTFGRLGASAVMLHVGEKTAQRWSLALAAGFTAALAMAHSAETIAIFAVLLGLSLAPFFPATFALLMAERPTARQAGIVVAVSGLGAAALPWMMGVISTRTGSLQLALALPFAAALGLLAMSLFAPRALAVTD